MEQLSSLDKIMVQAAVPFLVFMFSLSTSIWLMRLALHQFSKWTKEQPWPATVILYDPIKQPMFILCIVLSSYFGLLTSPLPQSWINILGDSLWSLFIVIAILALLDIIRRASVLITLPEHLPGAASTIGNASKVALVLIGVVIMLGLWGAPTAPILLLIIAFTVLVLIAVRDAAPDYFAALQLAMRDYIRVGESIKLNDGQQGIVTKLGWHNIELVTPDHDTLLIPNRRIADQIITKLGERPVRKELSTENDQTPGTSDVSNRGVSESLSVFGSVLSKRELEIAELVSHGATNRELAAKLYISESTVKVHLKNILQKLKLKNRQQLAVLAAAYLNNIKQA